MITTILNWLLMLIIVAVFVVWTIALVRWDGDKRCDPAECEHCPFPCEDRGKKNEKE